ncbi:hypothetical protein C900_01291 [Fulvivirga imtechensis AK7]|uniref:Uncharacterized protein n=1 Tax=Fulvivirga imtechensis AK7 TaxID=1237149 RepID=L8JGP9_9BACT|nr:hypothetical protein C900_01291 [Fulvivirga imtechensis AK7]
MFFLSLASLCSSLRQLLCLLLKFPVKNKSGNSIHPLP